MVRIRGYIRRARAIGLGLLGFLFLFGGVGPDAFARNVADWLGLFGYLPEPSTMLVKGALGTAGIALVLAVMVAAYTPRVARQVLAEFNPEAAFETRVTGSIESLATLNLLGSFRGHAADWALWTPTADAWSGARAILGQLALLGLVETELRDAVSYELINVRKTAHPPIEHREAPPLGSIVVNSTLLNLPQTYLDNETVHNQWQVEYVRLTPLGRAVATRVSGSDEDFSGPAEPTDV